MKITLLLQINHISSYRLNFCSYSLVTTYGTPNGISHLKYFPLSHYYFRKYMCSAQYGCCTFSSTPCFPGMLLRHFVNILEMVPVNPNIFIFKFHINCNPNVRSSYLKKFRLLSWTYISWNFHVYEQTNALLSHYTDRDIRFNVTYCSVSFHLFIP